MAAIVTAGPLQPVQCIESVVKLGAREGKLVFCYY